MPDILKIFEKECEPSHELGIMPRLPRRPVNALLDVYEDKPR
jgi:hypothetical protein